MQKSIDPRILDEAAGWLMRLHAGAVSDAERAACERWRRRSPAHASAWARAEQLMDKLGGLPPALAMPALDRPGRPARRAATARLALLLAGVPAGWAAWRLAPWPEWTAAHHTAAGERRELRLADGSRVTLNTASAIDVRFDAAQRVVLLRAGEILVRTAPDTAAAHRPFLVVSAQGRLEALGTRFNVRQEAGLTRVAVLEGAVRISPGQAGAAERILPAGEQASFTAASMSGATPADYTIAAWTQGMLVADKMPLAGFAAELARYRTGVLRCDPAVAGLPVSGAFPVADAGRALAMLVATYPVDAIERTRYWITLVPRRSAR